jgi:hypothetical protein
LRSIDTSQVKNEIHLLQQTGQLSHIALTRKAQYLHILALGQMQLQVLSHKAVGARDQDLFHASVLLNVNQFTPGNTLHPLSLSSSFCMPSTSRRRVL